MTRFTKIVHGNIRKAKRLTARLNILNDEVDGVLADLEANLNECTRESTRYKIEAALDDLRDATNHG